MICAVGAVIGVNLIEAAISMSRGVTASHEYSKRDPSDTVSGLRHNDGWGVLYLEDGHYRCLRSELPITDDSQVLPLNLVNTTTMVVHVRNASLKSQKGTPYIHPIEKSTRQQPVYFFHTGFAPDVYRLLGRKSSFWDSQELCEWLIKGFETEEWETTLEQRLDELPITTTAANFILAIPDKLIVCNWFPANSPTPHYYTMHLYQDDKITVVSSEPIPQIAPIGAWHSIKNRTIMILPILTEM